ncbi:unnamed protein product, partial [Mycena citricolor]
NCQAAEADTGVFHVLAGFVVELHRLIESALELRIVLRVQADTHQHPAHRCGRPADARGPSDLLVGPPRPPHGVAQRAVGHGPRRARDCVQHVAHHLD